MVRRGEGSHLVSIACVFEEEQLDFIGNLSKGQDGVAQRQQRADHDTHPSRYGSTHHCWTHRVAPLRDEFHKHAVGSTLFVLAEPAEDRELLVSHTHVDLKTNGSVNE